MKRVAIREDQREEIESFLASANGRIRYGAVTYQVLIDLINEFEEELEPLLARSYWSGARVAHVPGGPSATAYGYRKAAVAVTLERGRRDWFLVCAERVMVRPKQEERRRLWLTPTQDGQAVERLRRQYLVQASNDGSPGCGGRPAEPLA